MGGPGVEWERGAGVVDVVNAACADALDVAV